MPTSEYIPMVVCPLQAYAEHILPKRLSRPELWPPLKKRGPHYAELAAALGTTA